MSGASSAKGATSDESRAKRHETAKDEEICIARLQGLKTPCGASQGTTRKGHMAKRQKSIMPGDTAERCYLCGRHGRLEVHHCLHGRNRRAADEMGLTVHLCGECHRRLHDKGEHDRELEALAQETYEGLHGHAAWMARVDKNFAEVDG